MYEDLDLLANDTLSLANDALPVLTPVSMLSFIFLKLQQPTSTCPVSKYDCICSKVRPFVSGKNSSTNKMLNNMTTEKLHQVPSGVTL